MTIEREAAGKISTAVSSLAASAMSVDLSGAERLARAQLAADAAAAAARVGSLADPYRDPRYSRLLDAHAASRRRDPDREAAERLELGRVAQLARAWQGAADSSTLVPLDPARPPVPFVDEVAAVVAEIPRAVDIGQGWTPPPLGVVDPAPIGAPVPPVDTSTGSVEYPAHIGVSWVNVSKQLSRWGVDVGRRYDALVDYATSRALEAALLADLVTAAGAAADAAAGLRGALDSAEAQTGSAWGSSPTHIVVNTGDWPGVRSAYVPGAVPFVPVVTGSCPAGTALLFPVSAVVVQATPSEWFSRADPSTAGTKLGADRIGVAGPRDPAALAAITGI